MPNKEWLALKRQTALQKTAFNLQRLLNLHQAALGTPVPTPHLVETINPMERASLPQACSALQALQTRLQQTDTPDQALLGLAKKLNRACDNLPFSWGLQYGEPWWWMQQVVLQPQIMLGPRLTIAERDFMKYLCQGLLALRQEGLNLGGLRGLWMYCRDVLQEGTFASGHRRLGHVIDQWLELNPAFKTDHSSHQDVIPYVSQLLANVPAPLAGNRYIQQLQRSFQQRQRFLADDLDL